MGLPIDSSFYSKSFVNDIIDELGMIDKTIAALIRLATLRERS